MSPVLESRTVKKRESVKSRRAGRKWKKIACIGNTLLSVDRTQTNRQQLEHGRFADSVSCHSLVGTSPAGVLLAALFEQLSNAAAGYHWLCGTEI